MNRPYNYTFNAFVQRVAGELMPSGFDVASDAPSTYDALLAHWKATRRICVWDGASDQTIFGDARINYAFRAWHDYNHVIYRQPFTFEGEATVCAMQQSQIRERIGGPLADTLCGIVFAEVIGQLQFKQRTQGYFPRDQLAFVRDYLRKGASYALDNALAYGLSK